VGNDTKQKSRGKNVFCRIQYSFLRQQIKILTKLGAEKSGKKVFGGEKKSILILETERVYLYIRVSTW
jgi:hypothetical protein